MKMITISVDKPQRIRTIDIARGIAIFSIIIGHFGIYPFVRVVFTYHVPIFYIITGYLIRKENIRSFTKRKARSLLIPYGITCITVAALQGLVVLTRGNDVIGTLWYWIKAGLYGAGGATGNLPSSFPPIGAVWFLLAIFWGSLLMQLVLWFSPYLQLLIVVLLFLFGYVTANKLIWLPFDIQPGCCAVLYMYVGYLAKHYQGHLERYRKYICPAAFVVWVYFIYTFTSFYLVSCDYGKGIVDILASFCACYCIFFIAEKLNRFSGWAVDTLAFFGRYSLIVLCVHLVEMDLVDWWGLVSKLQEEGVSRIAGCGIAVGLKMLVIIGCTLLIVRFKENK